MDPWTIIGWIILSIPVLVLVFAILWWTFQFAIEIRTSLRMANLYARTRGTPPAAGQRWVSVKTREVTVVYEVSEGRAIRIGDGCGVYWITALEWCAMADRLQLGLLDEVGDV